MSQQCILPVSVCPNVAMDRVAVTEES